MFEVKNIDTGKVYTVYAVSGILFLIWNDDAVDEHWEWHDMRQFKPMEQPQKVCDFGT